MGIKVKPTLTPQIMRDICAFIKAGGFPHVASEASGVPKEVFEEWMEKGRIAPKKKVDPICRQFRSEVMKAMAIARLNAEIQCHQENPLQWLKGGPGKEAQNNPGWTSTMKPLAKGDTNYNILLSPQMQDLFGMILQILSPYPEARAKVAQALAGDMLPDVRIIENKEE